MIELQDREALERILRRDAELHLYELGDLDDFFFPHTRWLANGDAIALVYAASDLPVVVALDRNVETTIDLLRAIRDRLPARFYAHLTPGAARAIEGKLEPYGLHDRMILRDRSIASAIDTSIAFPLRPSDARELLVFYKEAYPGNWFDPRMLETGAYFGVRDATGELVAASGVHVVADRTRVAALGNVTAHPSARGRGFARIACAATCKALFDRVDLIGLNVESSNDAAIALYRRLGFEQVARYEEVLVTPCGP